MIFDNFSSSLCDFSHVFPVVVSSAELSAIHDTCDWNFLRFVVDLVCFTRWKVAAESDVQVSSHPNQALQRPYITVLILAEVMPLSMLSSFIPPQCTHTTTCIPPAPPIQFSPPHLSPPAPVPNPSTTPHPEHPISTINGG